MCNVCEYCCGHDGNHRPECPTQNNKFQSWERGWVAGFNGDDGPFQWHHETYCLGYRIGRKTASRLADEAFQHQYRLSL